MKVVLWAKDNNKIGNIELVEFLNNNLHNLIKKGFVFDFKIAKNKDIKKLTKKNITGVPAAIINDSKIIGTPAIKQYFSNYANDEPKNQQRPINKNVNSKSPEEQMSDYYMSEMNPTKKRQDEENGDGNSEDIMKGVLDKCNKMAADRDKMHKQQIQNRSAPKRPDNVFTETPKSAQDNISASVQSGNKDDEMWASKFEETSLKM